MKFSKVTGKSREISRALLSSAASFLTHCSALVRLNYPLMENATHPPSSRVLYMYVSLKVELTIVTHTDTRTPLFPPA